MVTLQGLEKMFPVVLGASPRNVTAVRLALPTKVESPILVTLSGIVMLVSFLQREKAYFPILVTLSGTVTLVRLSQLWKVNSPILVTLSGIVMLVRLLHLMKAPPRYW